MNKQTLTGFVLIGIILISFMWINQKNAVEVQRAKFVQDSIARVEAAKVIAEREALIVQEEKAALSSENIGEGLAASLKGTEEFFIMENDKMIVTISNKGGAIESVELKDYKTYNGETLMLFDKKHSEFNLSFFTTQNVNTSNFYFKPITTSDKLVVKGENGKEELAMRLYLDSSAYVEYVYTMTQSDLVDFDIRLVGTERFLSPAQNSLMLNWSNYSPRQERGFDYENQYTTFAYKVPDTKDVEIAAMSKDTKKEEIESKVEWVAFKQQFFSSIIVAKEGSSFSNAVVSAATLKPESGYIKNFDAKLSLAYTPQTQGYGFSFYFGANNYTTMRSYDMDFEDLIPLGWSLFRWISRFIIIPTFNFLGGFINSYGLIILILTIFIKLIIFPFTYRSYLSMAKMRLMKPEIDAINAKYPDKADAMKKQQETMELYNKTGVNPMGGCLPMLFQMPIIIAMFRFFPACIELRGASFLWMKDLASYDSILNFNFNIPFYGDHVSLMALLMAVSMYFTSKINMQQNPSSSNAQMPGMNFMMLYMMPVMLLLWFNSYSSGLCYYYFLSNIITLFQTMGIRRLVNEEKLYQAMKDYAKKPVKKSAFQQRMQEIARQQQEAARNK